MEVRREYSRGVIEVVLLEDATLAVDQVAGLRRHSRGQGRARQHIVGAFRVIVRVDEGASPLSSGTAHQRTRIVAHLPARDRQHSLAVVWSVDGKSIHTETVDRTVAAAIVSHSLREARRVRVI